MTARPAGRDPQRGLITTSSRFISAIALQRSANGGALSGSDRERNTIMTRTTTIDNVIPRADVIKRAARVGAEIRNVRLSGDLPEQTIAAINQLLLEHKVIFFRDQ